MSNPEQNEVPTAAMLVIGDEILSGRTQDANFAYLARFLATLGIDLREGRIVADVEDAIVAAINALRTQYDYVFTSGGIGPTHDDITTDAVGKAFSAPVEVHPEAFARLSERYQPGEFNTARQRMARIPVGAHLIRNSVSVAPGFQLENVFVMAGVPMIFRAMLEDVAPRLRRGSLVGSVTIRARTGEGRIAEPLRALQKAHPEVVIGSYPYFLDEGYGVQLVVRGRNLAALEAAAQATEAMLRESGIDSERLSG
ncbi:MAG: competence/damage-inducible protein A [Alphaproteobacteria bacterium]|nr:competence/damage-inducible protein A [Alphaproteobacteria bacterium]